MVVKRGPLGKPVTPTQTGGTSPIAKTFGLTANKPIGPAVPTVVKPQQSQNEGDLNNARNRAISHVMTDPKLANNPDKQKKLINDIAGITERGQNAPSAWGNIVGAVKTVGSPIMGGFAKASNLPVIKQIFEADAYAGRAIQAIALDAANLTMGRVLTPLQKALHVPEDISLANIAQNVLPLGALLPKSDALTIHLYDKDAVYVPPTFHGWLNRVKNKEWSIFGAGPDQVTTGNGAVDGVLGFGATAWASPLSHLGVGGVEQASRAGRVSLALEYSTQEIIAKYPVLAEAGVIDNIVRYGATAIPKEIRAAEGVQTGIRMYGGIIKGTGALETGWARTGGALRAKIGDALFNQNTGRFASGIAEIGSYLTPKYEKGIVQAGIGRGKNLPFNVVEREVAKWSVLKYSKGAASAAHHEWIKPLVDLGKRQRELSGIGIKAKVGEIFTGVVDKEAKNLYRYVEMSPAELAAASITPELKQLATDYKAWMDGIRTSVNDGARKFAAEFGVNNREIGFIDDYIHHTMTKDARKWVFDATGDKALSDGMFKSADLMANDITNPNSPIMFRKLRAPFTDPKTGETIVSTFFGKDIASGTIDEINTIFKDHLRSQGVAEKDLFNWFETDAAIVGDSYVTSMSKAIGRQAMARRAMEFSPEFIKPMIQKSIPDPELVGRLGEIHASLMATRDSLRGKVLAGKAEAVGYVKLQVKNAKDFLTNVSAEKKFTTQQIAKIKKQLDDLTLKLADASTAASSKEVAMRGEFATIHQAMVDEIATLHAALDDPERFAVGQEMRKIYTQMYPNHNPALLDSKSPEWFAEKILNARGQAQARELRVIKKQMDELRSVIDSLPDGAEADAMRQQLESEFYDLSAQENAYTVVGDVRARATYSDGFVYGTTEDITAFPKDAKDFNVLRTRPIGGENFANFPSSVAVHAPLEDSMIDLRNPKHFSMLFGTDKNGLADSIAGSLEKHGMPELGMTMREQVAQYAKTGKFDPQFEQTYPEIAQLIETIKFHGNVPAGTAVGDELITGALEDVQHQLGSVIPATTPEDTDILSRSILEGALSNHLHTGGQMEGMIVPQAWFDDAAKDPNFAEHYAVLMRHDWAAPKPDINPNSTTQFVMENDFIRGILDGKYEQASLDTSLSVLAKEAEINDLMKQIDISSAAKDELKSLSGRKGGITRAQNARIAKATKAKELLDATDSIEVTLGGEKKLLSRTQAHEMIATRTSQVSRGYVETTKMIEKAYNDLGLQSEKIVGKIDTLGQDLTAMFDQGKIIKNWSNTTGTALQKDIQDIQVLMRSMPPKGAAGGETSAWLRKVDRSVQNIKTFGDPNVAKAYERVTTLLHANEAKLARLEMTALPHLESAMAMADAGMFGTLIDATEKGWSEVYGLGVQMPDEVLSMWKPNLEKLRKVANQNIFKRGFKEAMNFFKTYATSSVGFFTRNGLSATFMNHVAGVDAEHTVMGFRAAMAIGNGPEAWTKFLSQLPADKAAIYEAAWRATEATGHGVSDEMRGLVIRGSWGERVTNNAYTRFFQNKNNFVERAVRMPMAIDSLTKGQTYDQAVARISRYHFDYSNTTGMDEFAKSVIPFWTWTSRNVPLQIVEQWTHPQAYIQYERIRNASPIGSDFLLPSYMQELNPIALGGVGEQKKTININGMEMVVMDQGGQWMLTPDIPNVRLQQQLEQMINPKRLMGQLPPFPKVLIELAAGKQLGIDVGPFKHKKVPVQGIDGAILAPLAKLVGGQALVGKDAQGNLTMDERVAYIFQNIFPQLAQMNRVTGGATGGKATYNERQLANILNWFGIPVRYVGPTQQASEATRRNFALDAYMKDLVDNGTLTDTKTLNKKQGPAKGNAPKVITNTGTIVPWTTP